MPNLTRDERRKILEEIIGHLDACAELLKRLGDPRLDAYIMAEFEGRSGGWLGRFTRDMVEEALQHLDEQEGTDG